MAATRKKGAARPTRRKVASGAGHSVRRAQRIAIAVELLRSAAMMMSDSGLSKTEQQDAFVIAQSPGRKPAKASKRLLEQTQALADLLSYWQRSPPFIDTDGNPKVLPIRGRGVTLQSLARRFVPKMRISEVVKAITRYSEVERVRRNKVALLGTILVLIPKTPELTLAAGTVGFQRLAKTILHNTKHTQDLGHFQRYATGQMNAREFEVWRDRVKPLLQQQLAETETSITRASRRRKGKATGVAMFIFRDDEADT